MTSVLLVGVQIVGLGAVGDAREYQRLAIAGDERDRAAGLHLVGEVIGVAVPKLSDNLGCRFREEEREPRQQPVLDQSRIISSRERCLAGINQLHVSRRRNRP